MRSKEVHLLERPQGVPSLAQFAIVETEVAEPAKLGPGPVDIGG